MHQTFVQDSGDGACLIEQELKTRILERVVPLLAAGCLAERAERRGIKGRPSAEELENIRHETLRLLFRILFLLYAEGRGCEPGLKQIANEIAECAGPSESARDENLAEHYSKDEYALQPCVRRLFASIDGGNPCVDVPDLYLAMAIDHLARWPDPRHASVLTFVDYGSLNVRHLGTIYEGLLEFKLVATGENLVYLASDKTKRRAAGSYYTPDNIVQYIVTHTIGPVLRRKLAALSPQFERDDQASESELIEKLLDFKVLDPAMGSGHFLVAALDFITERLSAWLGGINAERLTDAHLLKRQVLQRCIFGVDLDPLATLLAKMSLWLDASAPGTPLSFLDEHLRVGDSLLAGTIEELLDDEKAGFDCVIGNPPYLGHKADVDSRELRQRFNVCRDYANLATAFIEVACTHVKPLGAVGLLVPKSIQYVDAWQAARQLIAEENRLEHLIDVSEAFGDVLLEQSIFICSRHSPAKVYLAGSIGADGTLTQSELPLVLLNELGCLPAKIEPRSLELLAHVSKLGTPLGSFSRTSQALGYQAKINRDVTGRARPILRGKQVRPLRLDAPADWIDESFLMSRRSEEFTEKVNEMLRPKVVSQNIVAHVTRPKPRIWIISAPDLQGLICLNTVSTTVIADAAYDERYVSMVLNSSLASWFYYEFVFCRAVRTMHFDQYYAGKLPVPRPNAGLLSSLPPIIEAAACESSRARRQRLIDAFVFDAYELAAAAREFVIAYCYGDEGHAALDKESKRSEPTALPRRTRGRASGSALLL